MYGSPLKAIYLNRVIGTLRDQGRQFDNAWLQYIAPVHCSNIKRQVSPCTARKSIRLATLSYRSKTTGLPR